MVDVLTVGFGRECPSFVICLEIFVAFGFGLCLDGRSDAVVQHFDDIEQGNEVVGKAGAGQEVGNEVYGQDKVAQHSDDETLVFERDGGIGKHVIQQKSIVNDFATRLGGSRLDFVPQRMVVVVLAVLLYFLREEFHCGQCFL